MYSLILPEKKCQKKLVQKTNCKIILASYYASSFCQSCSQDVFWKRLILYFNILLGELYLKDKNIMIIKRIIMFKKS